MADPETEIERRANPNLIQFKQRLLELVAQKDWEAAVFAQNVILESMEFTVFRTHAATGDAVTAEILDGVIKDERRHLGFGENDLGRHLAAAPETRARLAGLKTELDTLVLGSFEGVAADLKVPRSDPLELGQEYLVTVERLGLT